MYSVAQLVRQDHRSNVLTSKEGSRRLALHFCKVRVAIHGFVAFEIVEDFQFLVEVSMRLGSMFGETDIDVLEQFLVAGVQGDSRPRVWSCVGPFGAHPPTQNPAEHGELGGSGRHWPPHEDSRKEDSRKCLVKECSWADKLVKPELARRETTYRRIGWTRPRWFLTKSNFRSVTHSR